MPRPLNRIPAQLRMGTEFDFHSIMIYGSHMGKREDMMWYPLVTSSGQPIYMGDSPIPQFTRLSDGDVERIAALYPVDLTDPENLVDPHPIVGGHNEKRSGNASALPAKQPTLEVIFPGVLTTNVEPVPLPTDLPKLRIVEVRSSCLTRVVASVQGTWMFSDELVSRLEGGSDRFLLYQRMIMRAGGTVTAESFGEAICFWIPFPYLCIE
jgi:hypothetical protein